MCARYSGFGSGAFLKMPENLPHGIFRTASPEKLLRKKGAAQHGAGWKRAALLNGAVLRANFRAALLRAKGQEGKGYASQLSALFCRSCLCEAISPENIYSLHSIGAGYEAWLRAAR